MEKFTALFTKLKSIILLPIKPELEAKQTYSLYLWLGSIYLLSRIILYLIVVTFNAGDLGEFMAYLDVDLMRNNLLESLVYFHQKPPGMNLWLGIMLKIFGSQSQTVFHLSFISFGLIIVLSMGYLLNALQVSPLFILVACLAFAVSPPAIYFENYLLYTYPVIVILCLHVVFFHKSVIQKRTKYFVLYFFTAAILVLTRSLFHLIWFMAVFFILIFACKSCYRRIVAVSLFFFLLAVSIYIKNWIIFDFFGSSSQYAIGLNRSTVYQLPEKSRDQLIESGQLSPLAGLHPFAGPKEYFPYLGIPHKTAIEVLNRKYKKSGAPNYNHIIYIKAKSIRLKDALWVFKNEPHLYLRTLLQNTLFLMSPATLWHPRDRFKGSPFEKNRKILGKYENFFNLFMHWKLIRYPLGFLLIIYLIIFSYHFLLLYKKRKVDLNNLSSSAKLRGYVLFNIFYVLTVSFFFETGSEMSRYRFLVDPLVLVLAVVLLQEIVNKLKKSVA